MYWGSKMVSKWIKPNWDLCRASLKLGFSATISVQALYVYFPKIFSFAHLRIIPKSTDIYLILTSLEKIKGEGEFGNMSLGNSNWSGSGRSSKNARFFLIASKFAHMREIFSNIQFFDRLHQSQYKTHSILRPREIC